jgi:NADP-dependent 3-hydroxy acid dehydrogenase YdfG
MDAKDELVVVSGGSSGIGEAAARTMAARGSRVVTAGRDPGRLAAAASRVGGAVRTAAVALRDDRWAWLSRDHPCRSVLEQSLLSGPLEARGMVNL